jgi:branched-chain amino acid transport system substrate-binding protein
MAPLAYAQMQVVSQAVEATGGFDDTALTAYARGATFHTVVGDVTFGPNGEWSTPRVLQVQYRGIVDHDVEQFRDGSRQIIVSPPALASSQLQFPYQSAM